MILHLFTNELCGKIRIRVFEASCFDCGTINREGVVVKKLGIKIRSKRSACNTSSLAHLTPWLKMLVVNFLNNILEVDTGSIADERAIETGLDAKDLLEDLVDLLLVGIVLISDVVEGADRHVDGAVPHSSGDITHVDSAETKITGPHELHLLLEVLVHSSTDNTRSNTVDITRTVDGGRTKDDERKTLHFLKISLGLEVNLGKNGPGISLVTLLGRLLTSCINLSSAKVDELLDGVLHSLCGNLDANIMKLLLIDRFILTILGFSGAVENIIKLLAIITSEALCDGTSVGKITLNELNDRVGEDGSMSRVEESGLREHLINATKRSDSASVDEILAKVTANEASTTKNENGCHYVRLL